MTFNVKNIGPAQKHEFVILKTDLAPEALLRARPGHEGAQRFFTTEGRPFCLYVVVGSAGAARTLPDVNRLVASLRFSPVPRVG